MAARQDLSLDETSAQAETQRVAREQLARAQAGLRPLELIATIAPLLGLLGTVLGMMRPSKPCKMLGLRQIQRILQVGSGKRF